MRTKKKIMLATSIAALLIMTGCSSSSDATKGSVNTIISGTAIDGVISGATVCIDVNTNEQCDTGEPTDITDFNGKFDLDSAGVTGPLLLIGGTDQGTGLAFSGLLKAPAGSTVVTPLTSATQALVENGKSVEEAEKTIKKALGIEDVNVDLMSYDPFEAIGKGDAKAKDILEATAKLQTIVHAVSSSIAGADSGTDISDTMDSAMANIAQSLEDAVELAGDNDVVIDKSLVSNATKETANEVFKFNTKAKVAAKAIAESAAVEAIAVAEQTARKIATADDLTEVETNFNAGMIITNESLEDSVEKKSADAKASVTDANVAAIDAAQKKQEEADALIVAKAAEAARLEAEAKEAEAKAASLAATKADIIAAAEAAQAAAEAAEAKAAAEVKAAEAAEEAARLEREISAVAAAEKEAAAAKEIVAAKAAEALAKLEAAAAKAAAKAAAEIEAEDAAAAKAAADVALKAAEDKINAAKKAAADAEAAVKAAADEAARIAAETAAANEAAAIQDAKDAQAKLAEDCRKLGGEMLSDNTCKLPSEPIITGITGGTIF